MYTAEYAANFVKFLGTTREQGNPLAPEHGTWLDACFTKKQSNDREGNAVDGKHFLSADARYVYRNPKNPIIVNVGGKDHVTTQVEIPVVLLRNIQSPEFALKRAAESGISRNLTQLDKGLPESVEELTPAMRDKALALKAKLDAMLR